jgi:hypothetical protein
MLTIVEGSFYTEKRKGPKGSYNTNFAHAYIMDDGVRKNIDVYFNTHNGMYGLEVYQGYNYDVKASVKDRSYSRHYPKFRGMPDKYSEVAHWLYSKVPKRD